MSARLLPVLLLLSGCAVGDAIGTGLAAIGDGTKYVIDRVDGQPDTADAPPADQPVRPPPAPGPAVGGPTVNSAPTAPIEVEPLD